MLAVGNDELGSEVGDTTECPRCGQQHEVRLSNDSDGKPSRMLLYVACPESDSLYLVGLNGRRVERFYKNGSGRQE